VSGILLTVSQNVTNKYQPFMSFIATV